MEVYYIFFLPQLYASSVLLISALKHSAHMFRYCPITLDDSPLFTQRTILSPSFLPSLQKMFTQQTASQGKKQQGFISALLGRVLITTHCGCGGLGHVWARGCSSSGPMSSSQTSRRWWWLSLPTALCQLGNHPLRSCISLLLLDSAGPHSPTVINSVNLACRKEISQYCIIPAKTPGYP